MKQSANPAATEHNNEMPEEFKDICPYSESEFKPAMERLVKEPGFEHAIKFCLPGIDYQEFVKSLLSVESQADFQKHIMGDFLETLASRTTSGLSMSGLENCPEGHSCVYISNHRDIVLDASFLNLCFIRAGRPITQIALGNNLLIYEWITDLVKINRSFIVKRDCKMAAALEAAKQLSAYIHFAVLKMNNSVWIAQRQGRAKDSNDLTQEGLVKMMSLAGDGDCKQHLLELNITPVSISYEYDPNDFLKAREYLMKRRDPEFKKSQRDDLFSMETGLLSHKGKVHFHIGKCINEKLEAAPEANRAELVRNTCQIIDRTIHCGYKIFAVNYIAYDELHNTTKFADKYTSEDKQNFDRYITTQISRTEIDDVTPDEFKFMREMMLTMYANPLRNQIQAIECERGDY